MWLTCTECGRQSSYPKHCISAVSKVDMCDILWIMDRWGSSSCIPSRPIETKDPPDGGQATQTGLRDERRTHPHSSTVHKPSQHFTENFELCDLVSVTMWKRWDKNPFQLHSQKETSRIEDDLHQPLFRSPVKKTQWSYVGLRIATGSSIKTDTGDSSITKTNIPQT